MKTPLIIGELSTIHHPNIVESVSQAIEILPDEIKAKLSGVSTEIAQRLINVDPDVVKEKARGYEGETFDYVSAYYSPSKRLIRITQEQNSSKNYTFAHNNIFGTYLHELGHDFDDAAKSGQKSISQTKKFKKAYKAVIDYMKTADQNAIDTTVEAFDYFLSKKDFPKAAQKNRRSARDEVVAEGFKIIIGGYKCDYYASHNKSFYELFTPCMEILEKHILAIAPDTKLYPEQSSLAPRFTPAAVPRPLQTIDYDWKALVNEDFVDYDQITNGQNIQKINIAGQLGIRFRNKNTHTPTTQHPKQFGKQQRAEMSCAPTISS